MITKTKIWKSIREQLKETERSKRLTKAVMNRIKELPQDENKNK